MSKKLKDLVQEMDAAMGSVGSAVEILNDVSTALVYLREDMDAALIRGEEMFRHREHHREVRLLSELMRYVMSELVGTYESAYELHLSTHEIAVKKVTS